MIDIERLKVDPDYWGEAVSELAVAAQDMGEGRHPCFYTQQGVEIFLETGSESQLTRRKKDFGLLVRMLSAYITGISAKDLAATEGITRFKAHEVLKSAIKCMDADLWNLEKNEGMYVAHLRRLRQDEIYWQERVLMWVNALDKHQEYKSAKYFWFSGGCGDCPNKTDGVCCGQAV